MKRYDADYLLAMRMAAMCHLNIENAGGPGTSRAAMRLAQAHRIDAITDYVTLSAAISRREVEEDIKTKYDQMTKA